MENLSSKLKILFALVVILFLSVAVFRAGYHFYLLKKNFKKYDFQLSTLEEKNKNLKREISYLGNSGNLEVEARRQMNLVRKGEKVIVLLPQEEATSSPVRKREPFFQLLSRLKRRLKKILGF